MDQVEISVPRATSTLSLADDQPRNPAAGAPATSIADPDRADGLEAALAGLIAAIRAHWTGDEQNLDLMANEVEQAFGLHAATAEASSGIVIGETYTFAYPDAFTTLPGYSDHRGQAVKAVRVLSTDECDLENWPMYEIVAADGWRGSAYANELEEIE